MTAQRQAELAQAQREAAREQRFEDGFDAWAGQLLGKDTLPPGEQQVHDLLDWHERSQYGGAEEQKAFGDWARHRLVDSEELNRRILSRMYEAEQHRVRHRIADGGPDHLDTPEGLRAHLDRQWVTEHALEQAGRWADDAFEKWRGSLSPERRAQLDLLAPETVRPKGAEGGQDEPPQRRTRGERARDEAKLAFEHRARALVAEQFGRGQLTASPQRLVDAVTLAMDTELFGLHDVFGQARADRALTLDAVDQQARAALADLNATRPELEKLFGETLRDATHHDEAQHSFTTTVNASAVRGYGTTGDRDATAGTVAPSENLDSRISEGGRERLRQQWLETYRQDRLDIFGDPGSARRHGDQNEREQKWRDRRAAREQELPDLVKLQMAKEAAAKDVIAAVKEAATGTWKRALETLSPEFREQFQLDLREADGAAQRTAILALGSELHQRLDAWAHDPHRDPDGADQLISEMTRPEAVRHRLALSLARNVAENAARQEAAHLAQVRMPAAPRDAVDRFVNEHADRVTAQFDALFATKSEPVGQGGDTSGDASPQEAPGQVPDAPTSATSSETLATWEDGLASLRDELPYRFGFELGATAGMDGWLKDLHDSAAGHGIGKDDLERLEAREEWFTTYQGLWGPDDLNAEHWLRHQREHGADHAPAAGDRTATAPGEGALARHGAHHTEEPARPLSEELDARLAQFAETSGAKQEDHPGVVKEPGEESVQNQVVTDESALKRKEGEEAGTNPEDHGAGIPPGLPAGSPLDLLISKLHDIQAKLPTSGGPASGPDLSPQSVLRDWSHKLRQGSAAEENGPPAKTPKEAATALLRGPSEVSRSEDAKSGDMDKWHVRSAAGRKGFGSLAQRLRQVFVNEGPGRHASSEAKPESFTAHFDDEGGSAVRQAAKVVRMAAMRLAHLAMEAKREGQRLPEVEVRVFGKGALELGDSGGKMHTRKTLGDQVTRILLRALEGELRKAGGRRAPR